MTAVFACPAAPVVLQSGRLELFSLEGLAAHDSDHDAEEPGSSGQLDCLELQEDEVGAGHTYVAQHMQDV